MEALRAESRLLPAAEPLRPLGRVTDDANVQFPLKVVTRSCSGICGLSSGLQAQLRLAPDADWAKMVSLHVATLGDVPLVAEVPTAGRNT